MITIQILGNKYFVQVSINKNIICSNCTCMVAIFAYFACLLEYVSLKMPPSSFQCGLVLGNTPTLFKPWFDLIVARLGQVRPTMVCSTFDAPMVFGALFNLTHTRRP